MVREFIGAISLTSVTPENPWGINCVVLEGPEDCQRSVLCYLVPIKWPFLTNVQPNIVRNGASSVSKNWLIAGQEKVSHQTGDRFTPKAEAKNTQHQRRMINCRPEKTVE